MITNDCIRLIRVSHGHGIANTHTVTARTRAGKRRRFEGVTERAFLDVGHTSHVHKSPHPSMGNLFLMGMALRSRSYRVAWALSLVDGRWGWRGGGCRERQASSAPPSVAAHTKRERPLPTETRTETPQARAVATPDTPKYSNPIGRMISHDPPLLAAYASHGVVRVHRCISREASIRLAGPDSLSEFRVFRPERSRCR